MYDDKHQLISHYLSIFNYEKTVAACLDALNDNPHDGWALLCLASAYGGLGRDDDCIKTAFDALNYLDSQPHRANVYHVLGMERSANGDYPKAVEYHKKSVELHPENISFTAYYATSLAYLGKRSEAEKLLRHAESIEPNNESVLISKITIQYKFYNDRNTEEETISRYLLLSTQPMEAYYFFSLFHQKYGEYKAAFDYAVKAFLIDPNSAKIKELLRNFENLGYGSLLAELYALIDSLIAKKNFRKARAVCLDALASHPNDGNILTRLAEVYYELGKYDDCVDTCLKALKYLEPDKQAHICYILGCERYVKSDYIQAADYHKKAYDMAPSNLLYLMAYIYDLSYLGQTLPDHYKRENYQAVYDYLIHMADIDPYSHARHVINYLKKFGYTSEKEREQERLAQKRRAAQESLDRECREFLELAEKMKAADEIKRNTHVRSTTWFSQFYENIKQKIKRISN